MSPHMFARIPRRQATFIRSVTTVEIAMSGEDTDMSTVREHTSSHELDATPRRRADVSCRGCESRASLQTIVSELLYKNQVIRSELREARDRLREIEVLLFGPESHSPCLYTRAELLLLLRSAMAPSTVNTLGLGTDSFYKQD